MLQTAGKARFVENTITIRSERQETHNAGWTAAVILPFLPRGSETKIAEHQASPDIIT